tara:strand:+ start:97 stop:336 length:240 start_codon:yes stop_codon:yes gene_type:complete
MNQEELTEVSELYKICSEIHAYLEENKHETLAVPNSQWWQQQKQYGLIKRISKKKLSWFDLRAFYTSCFIRSVYDIKKR